MCRFKFALLFVLVLGAPLRAHAVDLTEVKNAVAEASAAKAPAEWRTPNSDIDLGRSGLRMFEGLCLIVGGLLIVSYLLKRFAPRRVCGTGRRMKIIERMPVSAKSALLLLEVDSRKFMVAVGPDKVNFAEIPEPPERLCDFEEGFNAVCGEPVKLSA